ncbi:MAG: winged helix-turn-helix transcriptional regulator [Candidatus Thorarchaeota archaeon]
MDDLDKKLLLKLMSDCRASFRQLARDLGVTCPTVKRRVDLLVEAGIIGGFTVELSQATRGVGWAYAELTTDQSENRASLLEEICKHPATNELFAVGSKNYIVFAELPIPDGIYDYGKFLRGLRGVETVDLFPVHNIANGNLSHRCKYASRGKRVRFTQHQKKVLERLSNDARMSILDLSEKTGLKPKRIRRILRELEEGEGVHFTIRFNPCSENSICFIMKIAYNEIEHTPQEIVSWMEHEFPAEHWLSFMKLSEPVMINYMTSDTLSRIETIIRRMKGTSFVEDVETMLIYHIQKPAENGSLMSSESVAGETSMIQIQV